ncbi:MAG: TonB-dependent receptor, partial [Burkholderiales bacterium]
MQFRLRRLLAVSLLMGSAAGISPAWAQPGKDDALSEADDAFGTNVGLESTGIYTEYETRGFSPLDAGNVRIDGIY